jgi:archaellum component FlaG (FlaF/FlaG flagellin family)
MAVAEIIGSAVGVFLLVIVAYLLVGGTLSTAETVVAAQKDITLLHETRLGTKVELSDVVPPEGGVMNFTIINTGSSSINDIAHLDVMLYDSTNGYTYILHVKNTATPPESLDPNSLDDYTWTDTEYTYDDIHYRQLDPGTTMKAEVKIPQDAPIPTKLQVTTSNGITAVSVV